MKPITGINAFYFKKAAPNGKLLTKQQECGNGN